MKSAFIEDGYSIRATIQEAAGLHPAVKVRFRPALAAVRLDYLQAKDVDGTAQVDRIAKVIKQHLESWDARNGRGEAVEPSLVTIKKLQPTLLLKLLDLVLGYGGADEEEDAKNSSSG